MRTNYSRTVKGLEINTELLIVEVCYTHSCSCTCNKKAPNKYYLYKTKIYRPKLNSYGEFIQVPSTTSTTSMDVLHELIEEYRCYFCDEKAILTKIITCKNCVRRTESRLVIDFDKVKLGPSPIEVVGRAS